MKKLVKESLYVDFKKGEKVLVNPDIIKKQNEEYEKMVRKTLGKHFKKEIHMNSSNTDELYNRALKSDIATITWAENSRNDSAMVNLIFDDGFECSATKTSLTKI
jgi:hypothetical protein